jgi:GDPmannose 4,6-dehydratase
MQNQLALGNLDVQRDWGHARDSVKAMWLMLQQDKADDYVVATGRATSVREFCALAFAHAGLKMEDHVVVDPRFMRPAEVEKVLGDATKARERLGWRPETTLEVLIAEMVDADMARLKRHEHL